MAKSKSSCGSGVASKTVVEGTSGLLLRRSVAAYLNKFGFCDTLSAFLSEAKVHAWKTHSLDLELIFDKHLKTSEYPSDIINPKYRKQGVITDLETIIISESEKRCDTRKKQKKNNLGDVETNFVNDKGKDGHEVENLHENPGNKKKKKNKECVEVSGDDTQQVKPQPTDESECGKFDAKSRDTSTKKELKSQELDFNETGVEVAFDKKHGGGTSKSDTQTIEVGGDDLLNEKDGLQKDQKKKKHKLQTVDGVLKPGKEGLLVDKENTAEPKLEKTHFKSKDKKKKKQKKVTDAHKFDDSGPKDGDRTNGSGVDLDETVGKPKDKKKKTHKLLHDSDQNVGNGNGIGIERKEFKKRKRLAIENGLYPVGDGIELNDVHVNKKEIFDKKKEIFDKKKEMELVSNDKDNITCVELNPSKKMRTEKSEEGSVTANGTASDLKSKEQLPGDDEAVTAVASVTPQSGSLRTRTGLEAQIAVKIFNDIELEELDYCIISLMAIENGLHSVGDGIELNDVHVNKKEIFDKKKEMELVSNDKDNITCVELNPSKKMRTEKSEEGSVTANGTASDLKSKEQLPGDDEAVTAAASATKSEKNGFPQKSYKKDCNGSAEPKTGNAFCRVKVDSVTFADEKLQDNSYWVKGGADTGYGAKAQEILGQVRGRDFRHEKTKKKRGSYRGGQIDFHSHSVKFNYSDEE